MKNSQTQRRKQTEHEFYTPVKHKHEGPSVFELFGTVIVGVGFAIATYVLISLI